MFFITCGYKQKCDVITANMRQIMPNSRDFCDYCTSSRKMGALLVIMCERVIKMWLLRLTRIRLQAA